MYFLEKIKHEITCAILTKPSASVLYPSIVRFLYLFLLCNSINNLLPSLFKKCGYCNANCKSNSVSSIPLGGNVISLDLNVLFELCILTAMLIDVKSTPSDRNITSLDNVNVQSLQT